MRIENYSDIGKLLITFGIAFPRVVVGERVPPSLPQSQVVSKYGLGIKHIVHG